jgi:hypothetical protein
MTADPESNPDPAQDPGEVEDPGQQDPADASQPPQTQAQAQAALASPDITTTGSTTMTAITSLAGSGLLMNGGTDLASWGQASFWVTSSAMTVTAELTVNPALNASFQYTLLGSGKTYATKNLRIQRVFGSDALQALATTGTIDCGALPSNQATPVTLSLDRTAATFDVLIAGAPSACMDLPTRIEGPIRAFRVTDSGYLDQGGRIEFTDLSLF